MADPFIGQIKIFAGTFAPRSYAFCDGALLSISQFTALFSILGTTYGGDGRTTFGLPDLRDRVPVHQGQGAGLSAYRLGQRGGATTETLTEAELPAHTHQWDGIAVVSTQATPANNSLAEPPAGGRAGGGAKIYGPAANLVALSPDSMDPSGGAQPHANQQPYLGLNYIIALEGIYPSRS
jgi:microcystin-dependent protein